MRHSEFPLANTSLSWLFACLICLTTVSTLRAQSPEAPPASVEAEPPSAAATDPAAAAPSDVPPDSSAADQSSDATSDAPHADAEAAAQQAEAAARASAEQVARQTPVLALEYTEVEDFDADMHYSGPLFREIIRQAWLLAAREELGMATRDATLRESLTSDLSAPPILRCKVSSRGIWIYGKVFTSQWRVTLLNGDGDPATQPAASESRASAAAPPAFQTYYELVRDWSQVPELVENCEADARTRYVTALRQLGTDILPQEKATVSAPQAWDTARAELLRDANKMDFIHQWITARRLHGYLSQLESHDRSHGKALPDGDQLTATSGDPVRLLVLGELSRTYAHLGVLCGYQFNAFREVYIARSLLYSQRAVGLYPEAPLAYWYRAYAYGLGGHGRYAKSSVDAAEAKGEAGDARPRPDWADLCLAYFSNDTKQLKKFARQQGEQQPLALLLLFEHGIWQGDQQDFSAMCQRMQKYDVATHKVFGEQMEFGTFEDSRRNAETWTSTFEDYLRESLALLDDVPADVKAACVRTRQGGIIAGLFGGGSVRLVGPDVSRKLRAAGALGRDAQEPAWDGLASFVQEENFLQAFQRIADFQNATDRDLTREFRELQPLVAGHPWEAAFRVRNKQDKGVQALLDQLEVRDVKPRMLDLTDRLWQEKSKTAGEWVGYYARERSFKAMDHTVIGVLENARKFTDNGRPKATLELGIWAKALSPGNRQGQRLRAEFDPSTTLEELKELEAGLADDHLGMVAVGLRYGKFNEFDAAERCFKEAIRIGNRRLAYECLADYYLQQKNDVEAWLDTLQDALDKTPGPGLSNHQIGNGIARTLMKRGDYERAKPYAEMAAESYSAWGLMVAADVNEGLKNWDKSEGYTQDLGNGYLGHGMEHYLWCMRNNRGDLVAARLLCRRAMAPENEPDKPRAAACRYLMGEQDEAKDLATEDFRKLGNIEGWGLSLLLADEAGDQALVADLRQKVETDRSRRDRQLTDDERQYDRTFVATFDSTLESAARLELLNQLDALRRKIQTNNTRAQVRQDLLVGWIHQRAGNVDSARKYYESALAAQAYREYETTLAAFKLRQLPAAEGSGGSPVASPTADPTATAADQDASEAAKSPADLTDKSQNAESANDAAQPAADAAAEGSSSAEAQ